MKLKYKKLIIIITVFTLAIGFLVLTLIPTGGSTINNALDADLQKSENKEINDIIQAYFNAKKTVDIDALSTLVSDPNQINKEKFTAMAEYVEDYQNINCYTIENEDTNDYRVYVAYDMKLKNISTLVPCLTAYYLTSTSDSKYVIYLSALDASQEEFINAADQNQAIIDLKTSIASKLQKAIDSDATFKQLYQKMDQVNQSAAASSKNAGAATNSAAN